MRIQKYFIKPARNCFYQMVKNLLHAYFEVRYRTIAKLTYEQHVVGIGVFTLQGYERYNKKELKYICLAY